MMRYLRQILFEMKHQKMMTWVSISGTALAIFLVMVFIMTDRIHTVGVSPENKRERIMKGTGVHIETKGTYSSGGMDYQFAKKIYDDLDGVEMICYIYVYDYTGNVKVKGGNIHRMTRKLTDANFWKLYDFNFIEGKPFEASSSELDAKEVVLTESSARALFGELQVVGREIMIESYPYRVIGVVENVNPILSTTYADMYIPFNPANVRKDDIFPDYRGNVIVHLLLKPGVEYSYVKSQVAERFAKVNSAINSKEGFDLIYHEQPYTNEESAFGGYGSNSSPDLEKHNKENLIIFIVALLIPAINLNCMTRGRLRHRVSEIGVRRAFGARMSSIVYQLIMENFIITLIGGVIGLILCVAFMMTLANLFFNFSGSIWGITLEKATAVPDFNMLFIWGNFIWTIVLCFILNILSALLPAFKAARIKPAEAIVAAK